MTEQADAARAAGRGFESYGLLLEARWLVYQHPGRWPPEVEATVWSIETTMRREAEDIAAVATASRVLQLVPRRHPLTWSAFTDTAHILQEFGYLQPAARIARYLRVSLERSREPDPQQLVSSLCREAETGFLLAWQSGNEGTAREALELLHQADDIAASREECAHWRAVVARRRAQGVITLLALSRRAQGFRTVPPVLQRELLSALDRGDRDAAASQAMWRVSWIPTKLSAALALGDADLFADTGSEFARVTRETGWKGGNLVARYETLARQAATARPRRWHGLSLPDIDAEAPDNPFWADRGNRESRGLPLL